MWRPTPTEINLELYQEYKQISGNLTGELGFIIGEGAVRLALRLYQNSVPHPHPHL